MTVLPIVVRELSVLARRRNTYWIRVIGSAVASLLMLWFFVITAAPGSFMAQGKTLFEVLSFLAFIYCLLVGPLVTADSLSSEKRDGTLGLLFLTDLKGHDVILGKLVSSSAQAVSGLLAIVPMLSVALLLGGVGPDEILRTVVVLGNTLFFSLITGIFISTFSQNERKAVFAALFVVLLVAGLPYHIAYLAASRNDFQPPTWHLDGTLLGASPVFAFYLARQSPLPANLFPAFAGSLAQTHALSWVLFGIASLFVPHVWKDRPSARKERTWIPIKPRPGSAIRQSQSALRRRRDMLAKHPLYWLSSRGEVKPGLVWVLVVPIAWIGFFVFFKYPTVFYESALFLLVIVHALVKVWFVAETCGRWVNDRRSGLLELLLCAPLRTRDLIKGQNLALRRHFGSPVFVVITLTILAWVGIMVLDSGTGTRTGRNWLIVWAVSMVADLVALRWVGLWAGLTAPGLNRAMVSTLWQVLGWRWLIFLFISSLAATWAWTGLGRVPVLTSPFFWLVLALLLDLRFGKSARQKFYRYSRAVAANPGLSLKALEETTAEPSSEPGVAATEPPAAAVNGGPTRRPRWRRWGLAGSFGLILLIGAAAYRYYLHRTVATALARSRQAGLPLTTSDFYDTRPVVRNAVNAADVLDALSPFIVRTPQLPLQIQQNLPDQRKNEFPGPGRPPESSMKEAMAGALAFNRGALDLLYQAGSLEYGRYAPFAINAVAAMRQKDALAGMVTMLEFEILVRGDAGDLKGALESLHALFSLGHSLGHEGFYFFAMQRVAFLKGLAGINWLVSRHLLDSSTLSSLQTEVDRASLDEGLDWTLRHARAWETQTYRGRFNPNIFGPWGAPPAEIMRRQIYSNLSRWSGVRDRQFRAILDSLDETSRLLADPWPLRLERSQRLVWKYGRQERDDFLYNPGSFYEYTIKPSAEFEAYRQTARAALAVEQYGRRKEEKVPPSLQDLIPAFLKEVPIDPFNGQPLRFLRRPIGYCVYSVGNNRADDGGADSGKIWRGGSTAAPDICFRVQRN